TQREQAAGVAYWHVRQRAGVAPATVDQAWEQLARHVGAQRAAWVIHATDPTGPAATTRDSGFDISVAARLLPDRFAVVALSAGDPIDLAAPGSDPRYV